MPNTITTKQLAVRLQSIGIAAQRAQKKAVFEAALMIKNSVERQTAVATKGSMGFSNMDRKLNRSGRVSAATANSSKLRVGFDVKGELHPTALLVARGPWGLIEYGSVAHTIIPRMESLQRKGVSKAAYKRAVTQRRLDIAFGGVGALSGLQPLAPAAGGGSKPVYRVEHKGTRGKKPFHTGVMLVRDEAARRALGVVSNAVVDIIRSGRQEFTYVRGETGAYTSAGMGL